jgi:hypothetical protein
MATYVITVVWARPDLSTVWFQDPATNEAEKQELELIANLSISDTQGLSFESVWTFDESVKAAWMTILQKYSVFIADEKIYRKANGISRNVTTTLDGVVVPNF